jgi:hypothetical protein
MLSFPPSKDGGNGYNCLRNDPLSILRFFAHFSPIKNHLK